MSLCSASRLYGWRRLALISTTVMAALPASAAQAAPSWLAPFELGQTANGVVMTADGTTVYGGTAPDAGNRASVQVRPPGGPLGARQLLSAASVGPPALAAGPSGHMAAAWVEGGEVRTAVMAPGTTSFANTVPMPAIGDSPSSLAIAVDAGGNVHAAWGSSGGFGQPAYLRYGLRPANGGSATAQTLKTAGPTAGMSYSYFTSIAAADDGALIVGWHRLDSASSSEGSELGFALGTAGGPFVPTTLDAETHPTGPPTTFLGGPWVAMNASGRAAVLWTRKLTSNPTEARFRAGTASGLSATIENALVAAGTNPFNFNLGLGPDGRAIVTWIATNGATQRTQAGYRPAGGAFGPAQTLTSIGTQPVTPTLAVGRGGHSILVIATYTSPTCAFEAALAAPGGAFGPPIALSSPFSSSCVPPSAALTPAGDGVASWRGVRGPGYLNEAAGLDGSGPVLNDFSVPSTGTAGTPVAFSVRPVDIWSPVTTSWNFGDGATADGTQVQHTFAATGDRTVTVTATDAAGNSSTASGPVAVAAAPPPAAGDSVAPAISALSLKNKVFAVAKRPTALIAATTPPPRGTVIRFTLSEPGAVTVAIRRQRPGRRAKSGRCVRPTAANRNRKRCVRLVRVGTLRRTGKAGANRIAFSGRLGTKALRPGRYRATLRATDAAGNRSKGATVRFRIVRP